MACTATTTPPTAAQNRSETGQSFSAANYNVFGHLLDESIVQSGGNPRGHCLFTGDARGLDSKRSGRPVGAVRTARKPPTSACLFGANFGAISYNFIAYSLIVSDAQPNGSRHVHHPCTGDAHGLDLQRSGRPVGAVRTAQKPPTSACFLGANFGAISYNFIAYSLIVSDAQPNGSLHVHHPCNGDAHGLD